MDLKPDYGFELKQAHPHYNIYRTSNKKFFIKVFTKSKKVLVIPLKDIFIKTEEKYDLKGIDENEAFFENWFFQHDEITFHLKKEADVLKFLESLDIIEANDPVYKSYRKLVS